MKPAELFDKTIIAWNRVEQVRLLKKFMRTGLHGLKLRRPRFRITFSDEVLIPSDMRLRRHAEHIELTFSPRFKDYIVFWYMVDKPASYYYWFDQCDDDVAEIIVSPTDGNYPSLGRFSFSSNNPAIIPVPDAHFFRGHGYWQIDELAAANSLAWHERTSDLVWRGGNNGGGLFTVDPGLMRHHAVMQRVRLYAMAPEIGIDFKFVVPEKDMNYNALKTAGMLGDSIDEKLWAGKKFGIDIDGVTNTWSNLLVRMKLGCCVLKVDSEYGYRQWYYDRIRPWEHFVPVRADLSDLADKVEWLRNHDTEAQDIALRAQAVARSMTFESETAEAVRIITQYWKT